MPIKWRAFHLFSVSSATFNMPMSPMRTPSLILACLALLLGLMPAEAQDGVDVVFQPAPRPMPTAVLIESGARLEIYFTSLKQGGIGLLRLTGAGIQGARLDFLGEQRQFFLVEDDARYALLNIDMNASPGLRELTVTVEQGSQEVRFRRVIRVESAPFIKQEFDLPGDRAYLVDPAVDEAESARLGEITKWVGAEPLWDAAGFGLPLDSEITSPFGAFRVLNAGIETRHTGWDQRAPSGTPIHAMASGIVAFAGRLEIRGDVVILDHGLGVYTLYAHLSAALVTAGEQVDAGQVIGLSGNSGRSSGPHLHWDVLVEGQWVDGLEFVALWLPS